MEDKLEKINLRLDSIEKLLQDIYELNEINFTNCSKMSEHVDFVEKTYTIVKIPLQFLTNKIECIMGSGSQNKLPEIKK
jgi:hypothetical protein